jgi:hypothetical protein
MKPPEGAVDLSDTEIAVLKFGFRDELLRSSAPYRTAALDNVMSVTDRGQVLDILVDHKDRLSARLQHRQAIPDLPD